MVEEVSEIELPWQQIGDMWISVSVVVVILLIINNIMCFCRNKWHTDKAGGDADSTRKGRRSD